MISETNGCGACSGFWKWFKPPHTNFFKEECNKHDVDYYLGGDKFDRKISDLNLLNNMKIKTIKHFKNRKPISREWYLILCKSYYLAVRLFGKKQFNYKQ